MDKAVYHDRLSRGRNVVGRGPDDGPRQRDAETGSLTKLSPSLSGSLASITLTDDVNEVPGMWIQLRESEIAALGYACGLSFTAGGRFQHRFS